MLEPKFEHHVNQLAPYTAGERSRKTTKRIPCGSTCGQSHRGILSIALCSRAGKATRGRGSAFSENFSNWDGFQSSQAGTASYDHVFDCRGCRPYWQVLRLLLPDAFRRCSVQPQPYYKLLLAGKKRCQVREQASITQPSSSCRRQTLLWPCAFLTRRRQ